MKRTTGFLAFMTVAALIAAGCGGRDDSSSSATTAGSATTGASSATTAAAAPTTAAVPPEATDVGITATEIHIGVVADVDTPISPGLSQPLVSAVKAWGDQVNANGGLAGRKVVVTFYDSKLNPDEAVNAYTQACQNEFATVGSGAFVLLNPDPDPDLQGQGRQRDRPARRRGAHDRRGRGDLEVELRHHPGRPGLHGRAAHVHRHRVRLELLLRQARRLGGLGEPARHRSRQFRASVRASSPPAKR